MTSSTTNPMIKKYLKKTPVTAIQFTRDNFEAVKTFAAPQDCVLFNLARMIGKLETLEGTMLFHLGDYIVKNVTGECYVCDEEIFKETYYEVTD